MELLVVNGALWPFSCVCYVCVSRVRFILSVCFFIYIWSVCRVCPRVGFCSGVAFTDPVSVSNNSIQFIRQVAWPSTHVCGGRTPGMEKAFPKGQSLQGVCLEAVQATYTY